MARSPLTIARAPTWWANSTISTSNESERTFSRCAIASSMKLSRSSVLNSVPPLRTGWLTIATTTSSNRAALRAITSRWPFVIGSYEPGQTAMRGSGVTGVDADQRVAVAAFVRDGEDELERSAAVALGHDATAAGQHRLERRGELSPQLRSAPVGGIEEDQIVCVLARECVPERRARGPRVHARLRRGQPERLQVGADDRHRARVALDEQRAGRPPRERLDAQRPRPREQVEDAGAVERPEGREQRLAHAVRRRPGAAPGRRLQPAPAEAARPARGPPAGRRRRRPPAEAPRHDAHRLTPSRGRHRARLGLGERVAQQR